MNNYYVYMLFDWRGNPFYVGKGKEGKRRREYSHERASCPINWLKNNVIEQTWIMLDDIPKLVLLINTLGRLDLGTGCLTNMTDGGQGTSGYKYGRERSLKANANQTIAQRSENSRRANASQTQEQRRARQLRAAAKYTAERRSERSRAAALARSPEKRAQIAAARQLALMERRTDPNWVAFMQQSALRMREQTTPEQRSAAAFKREAKKRAQGYERPPQLSRRRLSVDQVYEIRAATKGWKALAARFGVTRATVDGVRYGRTYQEISAPGCFDPASTVIKGR